jgi:hypothetical protein
LPGMSSVSRRALRAAAALALGAATVAGAAAAITPAPAGAATSPIGPTQTRGEQFYCDLSGYGGGYTTDQVITFTEPRIVTAGRPATSGVSIPAIPLTAAESQQLASADHYTLAVAFKATGTPASTVLTGPAAAPSAPPTEIPALAATGSVTFQGVGAAYISDFTGFEITPSDGGTAMPPIKCYNALASLTNWNVTVTAPGVPLYLCTQSTNPQAQWLWSLPMRITASGPAAVGGTEHVTMTSGDTNFGAPYPAGTLNARLTGSLPVSGAQPGSVRLTGKTGGTSSDPFTLSGVLLLTRTGTDVIHDASQFAFTVTSPSGSSTLTCDLVGDSAPAGLTLTVAPGSPSPSASATGPGTGSAAGGGDTAATGAVPAGAPNTGGGERPGSDLLPAGAGLALVLLGGALWYAARRRAAR